MATKKKSNPIPEQEITNDVAVLKKTTKKSPSLNSDSKENISSPEQPKETTRKKRVVKDNSLKVLEEVPKQEEPLVQVASTDTKALEFEFESVLTNKKQKAVTENFTLTKDDVVRYNPSVEKGLTFEEADIRDKVGFNNFSSKGSSRSIPGIILKNLLTVFNIIMFGIALWLISVMGEDPSPGVGDVAFMIVILANTTIGIIQEISAKKTIDRLSLLTAPTAVVIRDGNQNDILTAKVVIDDIIVLTTGKQIPADCIIRTGAIEVNESLLTGESDAIAKKEGNKLYSGSFVVSGKCYAQVTAVGKAVFINSLTEQAKEYRKPKSNLLGSLRSLIIILTVVIIPISVFLFLSIQAKGGLSYPETVAKTAGAIVGMIPAGLFLITSVALAVGVIRLARNKTLVQELYCIEMLARVDTLCLDKTGTITDGTMTVRGVLEYKNPTSIPLKSIISAMMNAQQDNNLTSEALVERFGTAKRMRTNALIPFSSQRKFSAVEFDKVGTCVLGAPEFVIKENYHEIARDVEKQALEGFRVLVLGYSSGKIENNAITGTVVPIGLIMIEDTIRPDAIETIEYFKEYGVDVKVISGDNPMTVARIAERAGVINAQKFISLEGLTKEEVIRAADSYSVFGRVSPQQKEILVRALQHKGHIVAMTGDGVNDILALKAANTSIAMASGSEAVRNISHLVLLDSNFSSMPKVVAEGRRVINNVQKVAALFLTKTLFSLILSIIGIVKGYYPIQPSQLMMIDYLVIGLPAFILALEPNNRPARGNFLWNIIKAALPGALVVVLGSLLVFALEDQLAMNHYATSTIIVINATFTCFMVLFRVSSPFNKRRKILFSAVFIAFLVFTLAAPNIFNFRPFFRVSNYPSMPGEPGEPLFVPQILLTLLLIVTSYPVMTALSRFPGWVIKGVGFALEKLGNIEE